MGFFSWIFGKKKEEQVPSTEAINKENAELSQKEAEAAKSVEEMPEKELEADVPMPSMGPEPEPAAIPRAKAAAPKKKAAKPAKKPAKKASKKKK